MGNFAEYFPIFDQLTKKEQNLLLENTVYKKIKKDTILRQGNECVGLFLIEEGQLRNYTTSQDGKEVTLFRLLERDMCLFSASCMITEIQFDITVETEKDTKLWQINSRVYQDLMQSSLALANYTNQILATRMTDVMWVMDQILFKSFDTRLANFLVEESNLNQSLDLEITHDKIARHLGSAREVVTRMLKYFANENLVKLSRGGIEITDFKKLIRITHSNNK